MCQVIYPRISIVTPVFNQVHFLEETILSVLNQNYPNLEYIIIDGGSVDGSVDLIKKYESQLAFWTSEPDNGMYDALQKGFAHSTGEIMGWLNADDLYFKGCLFQIANVFNTHPKINWLTGSNTHINEKGEILFNASCRKISKYQYLSGDFMWIAQESTLWRRSLWEKAGAKMDTALHYAGDFELWLRFFQHDKLYFISNCIGMFRHREGQLSNQFAKYMEEVNMVYSSLKIKPSDQKIINTYRRKQKLARLINKTYLLTGEKITLLNKYKKKNMSVPPTLVWSDEIQGYCISLKKVDS